MNTFDDKLFEVVKDVEEVKQQIQSSTNGIEKAHYLTASGSGAAYLLFADVMTENFDTKIIWNYSEEDAEYVFQVVRMNADTPRLIVFSNNDTNKNSDMLAKFKLMIVVDGEQKQFIAIKFEGYDSHQVHIFGTGIVEEPQLKYSNITDGFAFEQNTFPTFNTTVKSTTFSPGIKITLRAEDIASKDYPNEVYNFEIKAEDETVLAKGSLQYKQLEHKIEFDAAESLENFTQLLTLDGTPSYNNGGCLVLDEWEANYGVITALEFTLTELKNECIHKTPKKMVLTSTTSETTFTLTLTEGKIELVPMNLI